MKDADLTWDRATLDRFIANPDQVVPGNRMKPYGGLTSASASAGEKRIGVDNEPTRSDAPQSGPISESRWADKVTFRRRSPSGFVLVIDIRQL